MGRVLGLPPSNTMTYLQFPGLITCVYYTEWQLHKVHIVIYLTSSLHNDYGNDEQCWIFVVENVQLRHIECKETKVTRTSKHEPNRGQCWISNDVCDCHEGSAFYLSTIMAASSTGHI